SACASKSSSSSVIAPPSGRESVCDDTIEQSKTVGKVRWELFPRLCWLCHWSVSVGSVTGESLLARSLESLCLARSLERLCWLGHWRVSAGSVTGESLLARSLESLCWQIGRAHV